MGIGPASSEPEPRSRHGRPRIARYLRPVALPPENIHGLTVATPSIRETRQIRKQLCLVATCVRSRAQGNTFNGNRREVALKLEYRTCDRSKNPLSGQGVKKQPAGRVRRVGPERTTSNDKTRSDICTVTEPSNARLAAKPVLSTTW